MVIFSSVDRKAEFSSWLPSGMPSRPCAFDRPSRNTNFHQARETALGQRKSFSVHPVNGCSLGQAFDFLVAGHAPLSIHALGGGHSGRMARPPALSNSSRSQAQEIGLLDGCFRPKPVIHSSADLTAGSARILSTSSANCCRGSGIPKARQCGA